MLNFRNLTHLYYFLDRPVSWTQENFLIFINLLKEHQLNLEQTIKCIVFGSKSIDESLENIQFVVYCCIYF